MKEKNKPEPNKIYALTGVKDSKCIANGYSWAESEVKKEKIQKGIKHEKIYNRSKPREPGPAADHRN
jgi:hypothetical protein